MKKIISLLISAAMLTACFIPFGAAAQTQKIKPLDEKKIKLHFAAWGDPQVSNYLKEREPYLITSSADLTNNVDKKLDALVLAGDITENSLNEEWEWVYDDIKDVKVKNFINATGNHDIRIHEYPVVKGSFVYFTNRLNKRAGSKLRIKKLNYSYTVNGYKFIVLGSDSASFEEADLSKKQLKWLNKELKSAYKKNHPTFVIAHQPLKNTHGLPETWGSPINSAGSIGNQSDDVKKIMNKYPNTIFITGHLHSGFGKYTYQRIGNIYSVNLPSLGVDNENGTYNEHGIGYLVEVYDGKVVFRARNFDKGVYVPEYDIKINLYIKKVKLSKKTYKYDGKVKTPKITVKASNGKNVSKKYYTVKYQKGRKKPGKYKVTVKFKGKYKKAGTIIKTFTIKK